jgi:antitoxin component YwqK of YwqJK toxin-antitoxin module
MDKIVKFFDFISDRREEYPLVKLADNVYQLKSEKIYLDSEGKRLVGFYDGRDYTPIELDEFSPEKYLIDNQINHSIFRFYRGFFQNEISYSTKLKRGFNRTYNQNSGILMREVPFNEQGQTDGTITAFDDYKDSKGREIQYKDGKKNGTDTRYFTNGQPQTIIPYKDDKINGEVKEFMPSGKLIIVRSYVDDKQHGTQHEYFNNGVTKATTEYVKGFKEGLRIEYREDGSKISEQIWHRGESVGYKSYDKSGNIIHNDMD